MRTIFGVAVALTALASPVFAQDLAAAVKALPKCAVDCLVDGVTHSACASNLTAACICTNAPLQEQVTFCVTANCTVKEALVTKNATDTTCGVPGRNRGAEYDRISISMAAISWAVVLLRVGFKLFATRSLSLDDYVVVFLMCVGLPSVLITHYGTAPNGVGRDVWTLTPQNITDFLYYFYWMAILYFVQVMLVKLCLLLFYLRIFPGKEVRRLLWGTVVFNILFGVVFFFLAIFQCSPISFFWTNWDGEHEGKCLNINAIAWSNAAISIALDLWMLGVPMAQLKTLKLHWKKKIGVGLMFCVGTFVTVVSVIRLQALVTFAKSRNPTWDNFPVSLWSTVEINVGIICTCMPTLRLLLVRLFPVLGSGSSYGKGSYNNSSGQVLSGKTRSRSRTLRERPGISKQNSTCTSSGPDAVETPGIVYHQTYGVHYEDDETSLVQMRGFGRSGHSGHSGRSGQSYVSGASA